MSQQIRLFPLARALPLVFACLAAAPALASDQAFERALESYRTGRLSDAYGGFLALGRQGDPDAARFALALSEQSALLRTHWELTEPDAAVLRQAAQRPSLRPVAQPATAGYDATGIAESPAPRERLAVRQ